MNGPPVNGASTATGGTTSAVRPWRVLCVCYHNRTRSVMMAALLRERLTAVGISVLVADVGIGPADQPITPGVAQALEAIGVPLGAARRLSRTITNRIATEADLVLAADVSNVISVSTRARDLFQRTFTLPEFVARASATGPCDGRDLPAWVAAVGQGRRSSDYLRADIAEILDPTGIGDAAIARCAADIDLLARRLGELWS